MNIQRLKILCTEIYKTLQNLNPVYMKDIFQFRSNDRLARSQNIYLNSLNFRAHLIFAQSCCANKWLREIITFSRILLREI